MRNLCGGFFMTATVMALATSIVANRASAADPATSVATISIDTAHPGESIPDDFTGWSFEIQTLLPDKDGQRLFRPDNKPLLALFKTLNIKSLRVGGNTADNPAVAVPTEADIDSLIAFARAAGAKVIYTLRLRGGGEPKDVTPIAKYLMDHYKSDVTCLAIGNEPNVYAKEYPTYRALMQKYIPAITAADVAPDALFCGPSTTPNKGEWAKDFAKEFGPGGRVKFISQHSYPGGSGRKVTDVAAGRDKLLEPDIAKSYQKMYDAFVPAAIASKLTYRLEETNSYFNGGAENVSNTQAAALWALDYMHWWALHGAAGMNFHTGDSVAAGDKPTPCWYASFWTADQGYNVHALGYALKAFDLGGHGKLIPTTIESADALNITAYTVTADDGSVCVTLINRAHGASARTASLAISGADAFARAEAMMLDSPNADIAATSGFTLGGAEINDDASWTGQWTPLASTAPSGNFTIQLPPATAAVVKLSR